jgi:hypothetical protein
MPALSLALLVAVAQGQLLPSQSLDLSGGVRVARRAERGGTGLWRTRHGRGPGHAGRATDA